jgi:hypothetical protein
MLARMSHVTDHKALFAEEVRRWREDPVYFVRVILGVPELWAKQVEILESVRDHAQTCVAACHDSAKTFTAACAALWFAFSFQPSKVITTAPTDRQVRHLLWSEIRKLHSQAAFPLPGEVQSAHWQMPGAADWFMTGFSTTPDTAADHATRFTGYHSPHELVIFDEAAGIPKPIWDAAEGLLTSGHHRMLAIGNPTDPNGEFARAYRSRRWHAIRIDAHETPNVKAGRQVYPFLVTKEWVDGMREKYGESSPAFQSKVRGLFPDQADDSLISLGWVQAALGRMVVPLPGAVRSLGVDVARFGSDFTCFYVVEGSRILHAEARNGQDLMWTAGRTIALARQFQVRPENVAVDNTGLGGGVTDRLREQRFYVRPENFGKAALESRVYADRRSELWWLMRDWVRDDAALADAPARAREVLREDLVAPSYVQLSDGRLRLEAKADMKKRLGRSPDDGDGLALALAHRKRRQDPVIIVL